MPSPTGGNGCGGEGVGGGGDSHDREIKGTNEVLMPSTPNG